MAERRAEELEDRVRVEDTVEHCPSSNKFRICLVNGEEALLQYREEEGSIWELFHTEVPTSQRGKGLGAVLAEATLRYIRTHHLKARLTCTYLTHYFSKHPEYSDVVVQ